MIDDDDREVIAGSRPRQSSESDRNREVCALARRERSGLPGGTHDMCTCAPGERVCDATVIIFNVTSGSRTEQGEPTGSREITRFPRSSVRSSVRPTRRDNSNRV